jgi:hypothetical protein
VGGSFKAETEVVTIVPRRANKLKRILTTVKEKERIIKKKE